MPLTNASSELLQTVKDEAVAAAHGWLRQGRASSVAPFAGEGGGRRKRRRSRSKKRRRSLEKAEEDSCGVRWMDGGDKVRAVVGGGERIAEKIK